MPPPLGRIKDWDAVFAKAHYRVARLCRYLQVSPRQLERFFRRKFHASPRVLMKQAQFRRARDLIALGYTNSEIARRLYFADEVHFCHAFKKYFHQSPQSFAPRWRSKKAEMRNAEKLKQNTPVVSSQ